MRKVILSATIVALIAGFSVHHYSASAQNRAAPAGRDSVPHKVGLIDMAEIFREYTKFKSLRSDLQAEVIESDKKSKALMSEMQTLQSRMKKLLDDSPEKKRAQNELVDLSATYKAYRQKQQIEFLGKESKVYKNIYLEVATAVRQYAEFYKYTLILRYNKQGVAEAKDPKTVIQRMNRFVVYVKPGEDITNPVLEYLNKKYDPTGSISARLDREEKSRMNPTQRR